MKSFLPAGLLLLLPALSPAQSVDLPKEVKAEPGELTVVTAKTDCAELDWKSDLPAFLEKYKRGTSLIEGIAFATKKEGKYIVVAAGAKGDKPAVALCVVVVGKAPDPGPGPKPDPDPKPDPQAKYEVAFFVESGQLDNLAPGQRAVLSGQALRLNLAAKGHRLVGVFDPDSTAADGKVPEPYKAWYDAAAAQARGKAVLATRPLAGGAVTVRDLPADEAGLWQLLEGK